MEYGISYVGGVGFRDDPHLIRIANLGLRPTERFLYDYDFTDGWRLDLRVEQILVGDPGTVYPRCTGGPAPVHPRTAAGVGLPGADPTRHVLAATIRAAEILSPLLEEGDLTRFGEHRNELAALLPLLGLERFDRPKVNRALAALPMTGARSA